MANQSIITEFWEFLKLRKKDLAPSDRADAPVSRRNHRLYGKQRGCPFYLRPVLMHRPVRDAHAALHFP